MPSKKMGSGLSTSLLRLRCSTKEAMPPSYWKRCFFFSSRSSSMLMTIPRLRKDSSRRRWERVSKLKLVTSKICVSGLKVTLVPRLSVTPVCSSGPWGAPRR
jgi:hypothetical protein